MDNAAAAVTKLFAKSPVEDQTKVEDVTKNPSTSSASISADQDVEKTVDAEVDTEVSEVAPVVEHTHVEKQHETREKSVVEKEKHQDHYHTTIQPLKDSEVLPEKHDYTQEEKHREINRDDGASKAKAEADVAGFASTIDEKQSESKTKEPTQVGEHVHHHLHETIVPVVEKGEFDPEKSQVMEFVANHACSINRGHQPISHA